ncbi:MAG TPA: alpha/beta hydrolase [Tepidisphaeraceae bacterium]|nr:alpha/beta hydrolase [Tepidisphaeraceae bacterium]
MFRAILALFCLATMCHAAERVTWRSAATDRDLQGEILVPKNIVGGAPLPTVVYLCNLSTPRLGTEPKQSIVDDLLASGHLVLILDYVNHADAVSPLLNADLLKLRQDIAGKERSLLRKHSVDVNRLFILPEGFRLRRDVEFARDGERVLAMDVAYPSKPKTPVPLLMEITCDNVNRMGSGSLLFCRDTLMEGGAIAGFAVAMVDHPVAPPYKGLDDPMPQLIHRMKAAVRTLRALSDEIGTNGKIGAIGFSRGATMAALLAVTGHREDLEGDGAHPDVSSAIQAALIHGNRYDYLNLPSDDPMLARFEKAWGPREANAQRWAEHGAAHYLTPHAAPMFLNTSDTESLEFRDGLAKFANRLKDVGVEHVYQLDADGRGHRVTTDPKMLAKIYEFFAQHLNLK